MLFFTSKPDISDNDKARLEFRLQQLADCVGIKKFTSPIVTNSLADVQNAEGDPKTVLDRLRDHLDFDFSQLKVEQALNVLQPKSGGGGRGGGKCEGLGGLPGEYDADTRTVRLQTSLQAEPLLATATITHFAVADMLAQLKFPLAESGELVEAAVIMLGLGVPRSQLSFVKQVGKFWDPTAWEQVPRPFLDPPALAYTNALAAWFREEESSAWIDELHPEIARPAKKGLKYLKKTGDSFFKADSMATTLQDRTQSEWLHLASDKQVSSQVAAMVFMSATESFPGDHQDLLLQKLQSSNQTVSMHAINVAEGLKPLEPAVVAELRMLTDSSDTVVSSKSVMALAKHDLLDEFCFAGAVKMMNSSTDYVVYAGMVALSKKEQLDVPELKVVDSVFVKYLQKCKYEFVSLFAAAYTKWVPNVKTHMRDLLQVDYPEYVDVAFDAVDALENNQAG